MKSSMSRIEVVQRATGRWKHGGHSCNYPEVHNKTTRNESLDGCELSELSVVLSDVDT